jgi:hypothetical protein
MRKGRAHTLPDQLLQCAGAGVMQVRAFDARTAKASQACVQVQQA